MGYWIVAGLMALWVLWDARRRRQGGAAFVWAVGTLLAPFIALPLHLALRPLKAGETRTGGKPWNILSNFALTWTILMLAVVVSTAIELRAGVAEQATEGEKSVYTFASMLALGLLAMYWFFPTVGALALGFVLRKRSVVERGPTGRLALRRGPEEAAASQTLCR